LFEYGRFVFYIFSFNNPQAVPLFLAPTLFLSPGGPVVLFGNARGLLILPPNFASFFLGGASALALQQPVESFFPLRHTDPKLPAIRFVKFYPPPKRSVLAVKLTPFFNSLFFKLSGRDRRRQPFPRDLLPIGSPRVPFFSAPSNPFALYLSLF